MYAYKNFLFLQFEEYFMWSEEYRPEKLEDVIGQKSVKELVNWYENWKPGKKMALLWGDPGTGKTSSVYALAKEKKLELIELNASDFRNAASIKKIIGVSTKQKSLLQRGKIILVDEVDGVSGNSDRGGIAELIKIIKESPFPIILTANDAYNKRLKSIRNYCELIKYGKVHLSSIVKRLEEICRREGIECDKSLLKKIGRESGGDFRSVLNDLEVISRGKKKLVGNDFKSIGYREKKQEIFEVMKVIFKTKNIKNSIGIVRDSDKDPEEIFWWIEENITNEYEKPEEIAKAYDALSKADIFRNWIRIRQNWRFKKYMIDMMSGGVSLAKKEMYRKFTRYNPPKRIVMYGRTKGSRKEVKEICQKMSEILHASSRTILRDYFPYFKLIFKNKKWKENMMNDFNLNKKEMKAIK